MGRRPILALLLYFDNMDCAHLGGYLAPLKSITISLLEKVKTDPKAAYSIFGITVDRKHALQWLFPLRGPHDRSLSLGWK
jgi:hypothetical protein